MRGSSIYYLQSVFYILMFRKFIDQLFQMSVYLHFCCRVFVGVSVTERTMFGQNKTFGNTSFGQPGKVISVGRLKFAQNTTMISQLWKVKKILMGYILAISYIMLGYNKSGHSIFMKSTSNGVISTHSNFAHMLVRFSDCET